jgi:two-component system, cell cycle sensor histidine kinase and response regulator CckA
MGQSARTVLIVDDDPQILRLVERMLKPQRFKILVAPRPSEALQICEREPVHLLISDVAMPEMDGNKLAQRVLQLRPETSILLISGHYKEEPAEAERGNVRFLKKPFFPSDLLQSLRELVPDL